ncbi:MAG: phage tail assembly protein [Pseudomonadota bacterium]
MTEPTTAPTASVSTSPQFIDVTLEHGIQRGGDTITKLRIRKPKAGELRGLNIQDLLRADVSAVIGVLPRISDPIMTREDADNLSTEDVAELAGVVAGFFMNSAQRELIARMTSTN